MDIERKKRRQGLKLIISEIIMFTAVILMVMILALIVSGYWINEDFKVERQGMLQIYSSPTGADVSIDGETSWLQRTNTSKNLSSGDHTVTLSKEGYDTWSKKINISEGLLYKLHYPRLFLKEREIEKVYKTTGTTMATISPDRSKLLLINETSEWSLIDLRDEKIQAKKLNVSNYFSNVSLASGDKVGLFKSKIKKMDWASDNTHILFELENKEWVLIDINDLSKSINLTKEFGTNFDQIIILNNSADKLLVLQDRNLHRIDVSGRQVSAILLENVVSFDHYEDEIFFVKENQNLTYEIGSFKINDGKITNFQTIDSLAKILINKFYDKKYIGILIGNQITLYDREDFSVVLEQTLNFDPSNIKVGQRGGFIEMYKDKDIATLDMEALAITEWQLPEDNFGWLDDSMIYAVSDSELLVYDFDGLNNRNLAKNVSSNFPVTITNDKWLYYFSDDNLVREWLIPR